MTFARLAAIAAAALTLAAAPALADPPRGYDRVLSPHAHAVRRTQPGEPVRRAPFAERYELRHGDCGGSDCTNPRYRSEIRVRKSSTRARVNDDAWFSWSFLNGSIPTFSADDTLRVVVGQWKMHEEAPAAIRLVQMGRGEGNWSSCDTRICNRGGRGDWDVALQLDDMARAAGWDGGENSGHVCRLFSMAEARRRWQDIVLNTNFANGPAGYVRVWVNGELRCDYRGQIVASMRRGQRPLVSRGIFASYTSRWDRVHGFAPKPTMVAYYDEFREGRPRGAAPIFSSNDR